MPLHLVLPGLIWPSTGATAPAAGLALPALERLLGHGRCRHDPARSLQDWLTQAFGADLAAIPRAALRRRGEDDAAPAGGEWLCADPIHLHFAREQLLLADATELAITAAEASALIEACNAFIETEEPGLGRFEAPAPDRWYLRLGAPARASFAALDDVVGRPVALFLPEGEDARRWQRLANELQVMLHNHPVNQAREAAGRRTINSLWFWGNAAAPSSAAASVTGKTLAASDEARGDAMAAVTGPGGETPRLGAESGTDRGPGAAILAPPAPVIQADGAFARGLARAAGVEPLPSAPLPKGDAFVVIETLHRPALNLDIERWRDALGALEVQWFAPALTALRTHRLSRLHVSAPGDRATLEFDIRPPELWKFWRRRRSLETLSPPAP